MCARLHCGSNAKQQTLNKMCDMYTIVGHSNLLVCVSASERLNFFAVSTRCLAVYAWNGKYSSKNFHCILSPIHRICLKKQTHEISIIKQNRLEEKRKKKRKRKEMLNWILNAENKMKTDKKCVIINFKNKLPNIQFNVHTWWWIWIQHL